MLHPLGTVSRWVERAMTRSLAAGPLVPRAAGTSRPEPLSSPVGLGFLVWAARGGRSGCRLLRDSESLILSALSSASLQHSGGAGCTSPSRLLPGALPALSRDALWSGTGHPLPATVSLMCFFCIRRPPLGSAAQTSARPHRVGLSQSSGSTR